MKIAALALAFLGLLAASPCCVAQEDAPPPPDATVVNELRVLSQEISLALDPASNHARYAAECRVEGVGQMVFRIDRDVEISFLRAGGIDTLYLREPIADSPYDRVAINLSGEEGTLQFLCEATFADDFAQGERAGVIHNHSVSTYIGEEGVFLSDGGAWHPQWIDEDQHPRLVMTSIRIEPIEGWAFTASGNPAPHDDDDADQEDRDFSEPAHSWATPRPVPGIAVVGGRHTLAGRTHDTPFGPVEIVTHFSAANAKLSELFIDAAAEYLDLYVPLLGPFPYQRFTIVENFFSSGFAYPGFTLLGPQVVAMGERALGYGYLDHELVHNWWGNGVYVSPDDGNWSEALTSYCANYYRRIADGGEDAGREYRRDIIMRVSSNPDALDNAPLDRFGKDPGVNRFVGYDKGAFIFMMLEHGPGMPGFETDRSAMFLALARFAKEHMGAYATWDDLRSAIEETWRESREAYFEHWLREHHTPATPESGAREAVAAFRDAFTGDEIIDIGFGSDDAGRFIVIDPEFRVYRTVPAAQIIPTLGGTLGEGGVVLVTESSRAEVQAYRERIASIDAGENLLLIGREAIASQRELTERAGNPITVDERGFAIGDRRFEQPDHAVLHTMQHPDRPGRFITVFHSNGDTGWSRLRLINFYTRDSTIVWQGDAVIHRATFEPPRKAYREE